MTDREISEKLAYIADQIEAMVYAEVPSESFFPLAEELRELSNQKYTPGSMDWGDVKKVADSKTKIYRDSRGRTLPF